MADHDDLVMDYAVQSVAAAYHLDMAHACNDQANDTVRRWKREAEAEGAGGAMGKGLKLKALASAAANVYQYLEGNRIVARVASNSYGTDLPTDEDVYEEAVRRGVVPKEWAETRAFR